MKHYIIGLFFLWVLFVACLLLIFKGTPMRQTPAESQSYWHWLDEQNPHEDMIHYITYDNMNGGTE